MTYRPWGLLDWALKLTNRRQWKFLGTLGTEERCLGAWKWLSELGDLASCRLLEIRDLPSRYSQLAETLLHLREEEFCSVGGKASEITRSVELLTELHRIVTIAQEVEAQNGDSVLLDITALPKRFFFPLLRQFHRSEKVRDLLVTYTCPGRYIDGEPLSENATDWLTLPGFQGDGYGSKPETLVASIGFMVESMQNHLASIIRHESVKLLIPFPSPVSMLRRAWESVYRLESARERGKFQHYRVGTVDLCAAFDRIYRLSRECSSKLAFAPFGPKPISAAMCLFALQQDCAVHYPQPRVYNPKYSEGVGSLEGKPSVYAYWIKHDGQNFYKVL
ncbi:MAG: hypothetical protein PHV34_11455 [Verrucomicrobiae bacterium]|nr:hypothetical protein [Verrucomicrobiae bacterium]